MSTRMEGHLVKAKIMATVWYLNFEYNRTGCGAQTMQYLIANDIKLRGIHGGPNRRTLKCCQETGFQGAEGAVLNIRPKGGHSVREEIVDEVALVNIADYVCNKCVE